MSDQQVAYANVGPVMMGCCALVLFTGMLITTMWDFSYTGAWQRSSRMQKGLCWVVTLLVLTSAALAVHDIFHYSTLLTADIYVVLSGTMVQAIEPLLAGLVALIVQTVLIARSAKMIKSPGRRYAYFCGVFPLVGFTFACSAIQTFWSIRYAIYKGLDPNPDVIAINFNEVSIAWMWSSAAADVVISAVYIVILKNKFKEANIITEGLVSRLVLIAMRSASYTAVLAVLSAIASQISASGTSFNTSCVGYSFWEPLPALYGLSMFTTLGAGQAAVSHLGSKVDGIPTLPWAISDSSNGQQQSPKPQQGPRGSVLSTMTSVWKASPSSQQQSADLEIKIERSSAESV